MLTACLGHLPEPASRSGMGISRVMSSQRRGPAASHPAPRPAMMDNAPESAEDDLLWCRAGGSFQRGDRRFE